MYTSASKTVAPQASFNVPRKRTRMKAFREVFKDLALLVSYITIAAITFDFLLKLKGM